MPKSPTAPELRFDRRVNFEGPEFEGAPCWLWTGAGTGNGYAQFQTGGRGSKHALVHRWNYERHVGPIPDGWQVDHRCRVTRCVNPTHLEAVPPPVNNARSDSPSARNARMTLCSRDLHELVGDNLHPSYLRRGQRRCRACVAERAREYRARKRIQPEGVAA